MLRLVVLLSVLFCPAAPATAGGFDHSLWDNILQTHVKSRDGGKATVVDYAGVLRERDLLHSYLEKLSQVEAKVFYQWSKVEQLAFLINAYNSWTVELVLTGYPGLNSIKDLGSFWQSPWKKKIIPLLGETRSLDDIEHGLIRCEGCYNDPRIHFAVNCASVGCPALRPEAYRGDILEQQLHDVETLFLSDRTRNRLVGDVFEISKIFKWYGDDFRKGWQGIDSLEQYLQAHAQLLGMSVGAIEQLDQDRLKIKYLKYDWTLNDS